MNVFLSILLALSNFKEGGICAKQKKFLLTFSGWALNLIKLF
ncbi:hypothetical protein DB41_FB00080 [Neochlamydia sp. TUME1]|nr:hypothetical protein DB41_FB00080 [Neochlamydia sp. TUME1]